MMNLPKVFLFAILVSLIGCKDGAGSDFDNYDARQVEGFWKRKTPPTWYYWFSNGYSEHRIIDFGQEIYKLEYAYHTSSDSIFLYNFSANNNRVWTIYFYSPDSAQVSEWGGGQLSYTFKIIRQ